MAFQRLNILAKKKSSGLHSSSNVDSCYPPSTTSCNNSPTHSHGSHDLDEPDLDDFGPKLERCKGPVPREGLSKRNKLFGSLRSFRSMSPLHLSPSKTRRNDADRAESPTKYTDPCSTPLPISPSLSLLRFEQSPADKPILELNLNQRSFSGISTRVQHSSPLAVPSSAKQTTTYNLFPELPTGTIPTTPGPMQRAFNCDTTNCVPWENDTPMPMDVQAPLTPVLTPLPGTNLSVGDIDPEFIPLPPSLNPSTVHLDAEEPGYFDILIDEQPSMYSVEVLERSCRPEPADNNHDRCAHDRDMGSDDINMHMYANFCNDPRSERDQLEHADRYLHTVVPDVQHHDLNREQGAGNIAGSVCTQNFPQHHHTLPFRPRHNAEKHRVRKDSIINKDFETRNDESCAKPASGQIQETQDSGGTPVATTDTALVKSQDSNGSPRRKTWGGNIGLYDGSGYGGDSGDPATPCEPDEGIKDVHMLFNPHAIDALPPVRSLDRTNCVVETALPDHDYDSLELMYRM